MEWNGGLKEQRTISNSGNVCMFYCGMCQREWAEMKLKRERGETDRVKEKKCLPLFPWQLKMCSLPRFHMSTTKVSGFQDFTRPSLMCSLCYVLSYFELNFFFTFMFLFITTCINLTSFTSKKTCNQDTHTEADAECQDFIWEVISRDISKEGMRQGTGKK